MFFTRVCQSFCSQGGVPGQVHPPGQEHPPGRYIPRAGTPPGQVHPHPPRAVHAGRYGQQAGGTHPTGMHSCLEIKFLLRILTCFFIWRMGKHFGENSMLMLIDLLWNLCIISEQGGYSNWLTIILLVNLFQFSIFFSPTSSVVHLSIIKIASFVPFRFCCRKRLYLSSTDNNRGIFTFIFLFALINWPSMPLVWFDNRITMAHPNALPCIGTFPS